MAGRVNWGHFHLKGECFSIWSSQSRAGNPRSAGRRSRPLPGGRGRRSTSCGRCPGGSTAAGSLRCSWRMGLFLQNPNTCSITAACFLCCSRQPLHKLHSAIDRGGKGTREEWSEGKEWGTEPPTFLPASAEDGHVLQVHAQAAPHGQGLARVGLEGAADRAVGVRPEKSSRPLYNVASGSFTWPIKSLVHFLWRSPPQLLGAHFCTGEHEDLCCSSLP